MTFYAQNGEDRALAKIFAGKEPGICLEVGANDGVYLSNTLHFERIGWKCILVEPNSQLCEKISRSRNAIVFECAASDTCGRATLHVGAGSDDVYSSLDLSDFARGSERCETVVVATRTLDTILEEAGVECLDFVTIDVEGHELQTLKGFTLERWKPRLVLLEDNSDMADAEVDRHMQQAGYFRFWRSGANDWYALRNTSRLQLLMRIVTSGCFSWKAFLKGTFPRKFIKNVITVKRQIARGLA